GGWKTGPIEAALRGVRRPERLKRLDHVPDTDLPALLGGAAGFVWPSLMEGFGLPVLEAMACGAPVVTSRTSSLPEVTGDAALLVDPLDTEALSDAMRRLATDEALRGRLSAEGVKRAAHFTWEHTATLTAKAFRELV
ncbi:MAG TPA: glycosyltransferase family 1 protein, partial [Candidatus Hydrogenedentes bacterium]|nr:glycosyltransferase family 1 protein [Candidatus Hydrogenedentota bacterium]